MADLKKTVETIFDNATGWSFGKYPSSKPEHTIFVDVQYPTEIILSDRVYNFDGPSFVSIRRSGEDSASILFSKDVFIDSITKQEKASYRLTARKNGQTFQAIETPDEEVLTQGDVFVFTDLMQDPDFKDYITIVPETNVVSKKTQSKKWNLNKIMERARPSIGG